MDNVSLTTSLTHHQSDFEKVSNTARGLTEVTLTEVTLTEVTLTEVTLTEVTLTEVTLTEVTLTSLFTETVHPTLVFTTAVTLPGTLPVTLPGTTPVVSSDTTSSQTVHTQSEISQTRISSTEATASESTTSETISAQTSKIHTTESQVTSDASRLNTQLPTATSEISSTTLAMSTSSYQQVNTTPVLDASTDSVLMFMSITAQQSFEPSLSPYHSVPEATPIAASSARVSSRVSSTFATSPSPSPMPTVLTGSSASTHAPSAQGNMNRHTMAAVIGGSLGGAAAVVAVIILAFILLKRRRRRNEKHLRQSSRQRLIRNSKDSMSSFNSPNPCEPSPLFFPAERTISVPRTVSVPQALFSPPVTSVAAHQGYNPATHQYDVTHATSNQDLLTNSMYLHQEFNPNALEYDHMDSEHSPVSPMIEISPPSRSVSNYSRSSWDAGSSRPCSRLPNYFELAFSPGELGGTHLSAESTLTLPDTRSSRYSNFLEQPQTHDSVRSDPFDLEVPANGEYAECDQPLPPPPAAAWRFPF
ncbi:hypothetical protein N7456_011612 [Penicillium angulare]|uniref:Uncharacterized protein n=1 Tax=Penicillium angulare TaxID=116970 RepID=A0A9W9EU51_9EURO|nr:hypothetical protein N7456_011612 [Penicillium angulare]